MDNDIAPLKSRRLNVMLSILQMTETNQKKSLKSKKLVKIFLFHLNLQISKQNEGRES